jgi:hypothetical protein
MVSFAARTTGARVDDADGTKRAAAAANPKVLWTVIADQQFTLIRAACYLCGHTNARRSKKSDPARARIDID